MSELIRIPVPGSAVPVPAAMDEHGNPLFIPKLICDAFGIAWEQQRVKLHAAHWACTVKITVQVGGQGRDMIAVDRRTLIVWLTTADANLVPDPVLRSQLIAFQNEAFDAIEAYFAKGGAINPRATGQQLSDLTALATAQMGLIQASIGIIDRKHLEAQAEIVLARGLGQAPQIDPRDVPLYAEGYLREHGVVDNGDRIRFGTALARHYELVHGQPPGKYHQTLANGQVRPVNAYTEADRPLLDAVLDEMRAEGRL